MDNTCLLHVRELSLGDTKFIRIQTVWLGKHRGSRASEKMVMNLVVRRGSCKIIGGEDVRKLEEEVRNTSGS